MKKIGMKIVKFLRRLFVCMAKECDEYEKQEE